MKRTLIFITTILSSCYLLSQNALYDLSGYKIQLNTTKTTIAIAYSTSSCHQCYDDINNFLIRNNIYDSFNVVVFANIDKQRYKEDMKYKRTLYDNMKEHFPNCENIYFNTKTKSKTPVFYSIKMNNYLLPNVFIIKDGKLLSYYSSSEEFLRDVSLMDQLIEN